MARSRLTKELRVFLLCLLLLLSWIATFSSVAQFGEVFAGVARYSLNIDISLKNTGDGTLRNIKGEVPIMAWKNLPVYQQVEQMVSDPPVYWNDDGCRIGFSLDSLSPKESFKIKIKYIFRHSGVFQDPPNQPASSGYAKDMSAYLQAEDGVETGDPRIAAVLSGLDLEDKTPKEKARKIFSFVNETLTYKTDFSRKAGALVALQTGWGRCEDYAMLFTALCRTAGIPARLVTGLRLKPEDLKDAPFGLSDSGHLWAEVWLPGAGWVSVDPTFLSTVSGRKYTDYRFFAGFYPDDLHVFLYYGRMYPSITYHYQNKPALEFEEKFLLKKL